MPQAAYYILCRLRPKSLLCLKGQYEDHHTQAWKARYPVIKKT